MLKIGTIVYYDELVNHTKSDYINYMDTKNGGNDLNISTDLPILFVGWNHYKRQLNDFHENVTILNKEIKKYKIHWEYSFNENKAQHVTGVDMFVRNAPYFYFIEKYLYQNIDPIFNKIETLDQLFEIIPHKFHYSYNHKNEIIYCFVGSIIYGINLNMFDFFNLNKEEIQKVISERSEHYIEDLDGSIHLNYYKQFPNFENLKRYLPVLLSKA